MPSVLTIHDLTTEFCLSQGRVKAVDRVSLNLDQGKSLALVGESGCGKTMLALSVLGLIPAPPARITSGKIIFQGRDLLKMPEKQLRTIRGNEISMIFQEPMTALNPVFTIGTQLMEPLIYHKKLSRAKALDQAVQLMKMVGIPGSEKRVHDYPHQLSGGMRQRIIIAMALACSPEVILADEPTTALDVTIQAQILDLIRDLQEKQGTSTILITHDLGVVAQVCHDMAIMYAGRIVEHGSVAHILGRPGHPYTRGLMASLPRLDTDQELEPVSGTVPELRRLPSGCTFHPRCPQKMDICLKECPPMFETPDNTRVRCWLYKGQ